MGKVPTDRTYIEAVEAITWLAWDELIPSAQWLHRAREALARHAKLNQESWELIEPNGKRREILRSAGQALLEAARLGSVIIYGKLSDRRSVSLVPGAQSEPVPAAFLRERVAVNLLHNTLEADADGSTEEYFAVAGRSYGTLLVKCAEVELLKAEMTSAKSEPASEQSPFSCARRWMQDRLNEGRSMSSFDAWHRRCVEAGFEFGERAFREQVWDHVATPDMKLPGKKAEVWPADDGG